MSTILPITHADEKPPTKSTKPLGGKAYGHIPHLPGSRLGPGDHHCHEGQARICTEKVRDKHDRVIVQYKYDGSCVAVLRRGGEIVPLTRAGYLANTSKYEQHHLWWDWAHKNKWRFLAVLNDGERLCGEWMAQAHGTRYALARSMEPFVAFDLIRDGKRLPYQEFVGRAFRFTTPCVLSSGPPLPIPEAMQLLDSIVDCALDPAEGAVWRVERHGEVDFIAKFVRPAKIDGCYLPEVSGKEAVWNWRPA